MHNTPTIPFPEEIARLRQINGYLDEALQAAGAAVERMDREYLDARLYMVQHRSETDPHEMFRSEMELGQIDRRGARTVRLRDTIAKLRDSPYFARVDFRAGAEADAGIFYIGRFAFDRAGELLISDWRSPIAGMFYDCELGPAGYLAPAGRIDGELTRKRQFKIQGGAMEYALESSSGIQDDVLQRELSHTSDEKMKSIIATIQKEQNRIIRNENAGTLIIQGVAGSGKTSIALHRVAFLLYRFQDRLSAQNVTILSPNRVFGDYIANVLPELGEEPIYEASFADIARVQLERVIDFAPDQDPLETQDAAWAERCGYKSTLAFVRLLDEFIEELPGIVFAPADYAFDRFTAPAERIAERFRAYDRHPVKRRLQRIADDIREWFEADNYREEALPKPKTILAALVKMLQVKDTLSLYKEFYRRNGLEKLLHMPAKKTLEWADVYPFLYLHAAFEGLRESGVIRHLVVDEMQDYTPVQYAVVNRLFPCAKTILGDFGQRVHPHHRHTLADLREIYGEAEFSELTKGYRSTYEILSFARKIQANGTIEAIERHGEEPALIACAGWREEIDCIRDLIDAFAKGGRASLGILAKSDQDARRLHDALAAERTVRLLTPDSVRLEGGATVASIRMSKGLEFDEVIIADADDENYRTAYERGLLYIACTRAMHRLTLLWSGEASRWIPTAKN